MSTSCFATARTCSRTTGNVFRHILVDEFQDTNTIQYAWLRLLAGSEGHLCCVGDDDQSVYGWRGARIENILQFPRDFAEVETVRLERNYRSTGNILAAANALIANNQGRMGKNLWTEDGDGKPIDIYAAFNGHRRGKVHRLAHRAVGRYRRPPRRSRDSVPGQRPVAGAGGGADYARRRLSGVRRAFASTNAPRSRNALAYCRLVANRDDDAAFERIVNLPPRGIGVRTVDALRTEARRRSESLWATARRMIADGAPSPRAAGALARFLDLIDGLAAGFRDLPLHEQIESAVQGSGTARLLPAGEDRPRPDANREPAGVADRGEPVRSRR